jgi:dolichyl-phosphate beta-glucosyltransferase
MSKSTISYQDYYLWKTTPLRETPLLSVVIPAYNESARIVPTIAAISVYCSNLGLPWELIVADDGSKDDTVSVLHSLGLANLRVLTVEQNGGKGSAVRRGMLAARGRYILFTDADNSTPIEQLGFALQTLFEGYDVVIGSRAADGAEEHNRIPLRRIVSWGLRRLVRYALNLDLNDTQCGFKLFRREAARSLCQQQTLMGFSFDLELLYLAQKFSLQVVEHPVVWIDAPGSKVETVKEARRFLRDILTIRRNDVQGKYEYKAVSTVSNDHLEYLGGESCELPLSLPIHLA